MSGILSILPVIIIAIIGSLISNASKQARQAREEAARQQQGARKVATMDDQLREQIRQRAAAARQTPQADARFPFEPSSVPQNSDARWPIAPSVAPSETLAKPTVAPAAPRVAVNYEGGGPQDRSVTRNVMQPRYNAEDSHGRTRAPHLQDDERGYDSFTGAATFRRSEPRARGGRVDIRPLLQSPLAMANAVILTEVLHHRGGRSARWSR